MSDKNEVKEIDLLELFQSIGKGIKSISIWILKSIVFLIAFGLKKAHWVAIFVVVGLLLGLGYHSVSKSYYSSGMVVSTNGITSLDLIDHINDLTTICKSGNSNALSISLGISDSSAKKIKKIEAYPYIDVNKDGIGDIIDFEGSYKANDTNQIIIKDRCYLHVELFENQPKEYLQKGLLNYINRNEYLVQLNQIRKNELWEQITETEKEIAKLDSLQNIEYFSENASSPVPVGTGGYIVYTEKDKKMYYNDKLSLIKNKQDLEKQFELNQGPITIVKNMSELAVEENPRFVVMVKFGFWTGLFCYFLLLILVYRKNIESLFEH